MTNANEVKYAQYRQYETSRITASNAMLALLAGAQLSLRLLQLTEGSNKLLPEVFPNVPHIKRFNLKTDEANLILKSADVHLGAMGVPYALALHEDYMKSCISLLETAGLVPNGTADRSRLVDQHDTIAAATSSAFDPIARAQINTLRLMRNCLIHSGGRASNPLVADVAHWPIDVETAWMKIAQRSLRGINKGDEVMFAHGEMILALAVSKTLDREANVMLQAALPRDFWADMVIAELVEQDPSVMKRSDSVRKARGLARHYYTALKLTDHELKQAITRQ